MKAHLYQTYWFYGACLLVVIALAAATIWIRNGRIKAREMELTLQVNQRTAELKAARDDAIRARDELQFQANHDMLTGLWNRRAILELLNKEIDRQQRSHTSTGLLILDVDHFKTVNDTYGHPAGDMVLQQIAARVAGVLRPYDSVGRYGGEEFLIVLPGCDEKKAIQGAERIRLAISSDPIPYGEGVIPVTASVGVTASVPLQTTGVSALLSVADAALYRAKSSGRNRVELGSSLPIAR